MSRLTRVAALAAACLLACTTAASAEEHTAEEHTFALTRVTVHPVGQTPLSNATVVVKGHRITAVGNFIAPPEGAEVIDLEGLQLYPGFVHAFSTLGLVEIASVRGTRDVNEVGDNNADLRPEVAFNADSLRLPPAIRGGVLTAQIHQRGGLFTGNTAVMSLDGWNWHDMTLDAPAGMVLDFPQAVGNDDEEEDAKGEDKDAETSEAVKKLDELVATARSYAKAKAASSPGLDANPKLDALIPVLDGTKRLFVLANGRKVIAAALDWLEKQELENVVLVTDYEARYEAEKLAARKIPVILTSVLAQPSRNWEPYDAAYGAPAALYEAGVTFAIAGEGNMFASMNARNLPFHAGMAAAFGLPKDVALESVTLTPAKILGIDKKVGSIESTKEATFFVTDGDPLEILTNIKRVWISGREIDLTDDHQFRLYEKYWNRPRPEKPPAETATTE